MIRYKLTDQDGYTRRGIDGETLWRIGVTVKANTSLPAELCTTGVIHGYETALLAVLMNVAHANYDNPRGWEIEVPEVVVSDGTKEGYREAKLVREIVLPKVTTEQRVRFGILCALEVCQAPDFVSWARGWLSGNDRSTSAAAAAYAASYAAADAADAAAYASFAAAYSADYRAQGAADAADAATYAAAKLGRKINFAALAERAIQEEASREAARRPPRSKGSERERG